MVAFVGLQPRHVYVAFSIVFVPLFFPMVCHRRIFVDAGKANSGDNGTGPKATDANDNLLSTTKQETLAELMEQEMKNDQQEEEAEGSRRQTLADFLAMGRNLCAAPPQETLAQLMAKDRQRDAKEEEEEKNANPAKCVTLAQLLKIEQEEFDQFVTDLSENEQIIGTVFKPKTAGGGGTIKELKGKLIRTFSKKKSVKERKNNDDRMEMGEKYEHFLSIKENDPALSQVIEKLQSYSKKVVAEAGKSKDEMLKKYLKFAIKFMAKRQRISEQKLKPEGIGKLQALKALIKFYVHEKEQANDGQQPSKCKWERLLPLLTTVVEDEEDGTNANFALEFDTKKKKKKSGGGRRKRRKKRELAAFALALCVAFALAILLLALNCKSVGLCLANRSGAQTQRQQTNENEEAVGVEATEEARVATLFELLQNDAVGHSSHFLAEPMSKITNGEEEMHDCAICLAEIEAEQMVVQLPCKHFYHAECLKTWFTGHITCPICRTEFARANQWAQMQAQSPVIRPMNFLPRTIV
ncbi:hypothetical protein niasHT_031957 [Heterodera trifolii]|uniref:RING-type domain-containing protein n=1 Tax=Heterodera trifolii TaxID=157864 RepID=A0ABD2HYF2_9BILA